MKVASLHQVVFTKFLEYLWFGSHSPNLGLFGVVDAGQRSGAGINLFYLESLPHIQDAVSHIVFLGAWLSFTDKEYQITAAVIFQIIEAALREVGLLDKVILYQHAGGVEEIGRLQIRQRRYDFFESENLLRDPIHFLVEGGGFDPYIPDEITRFSERERQLLGRYMREGGFLFIEGSYRYLKEMAGHLEDILGPDGQMYALPASHPLYSAYFGFASGFPGEDKTQERDDLGPSWYYPIEGQVDQPASPAPANLDPGAVPDAAPSRLGLWGVEVNGEVVAVLSDLQLHRSWALSFDTDEREGAVETPVAQYLQVGTNIIVHALLRSGGITPRRSLPVWAETSPREEVRAPTILPGVGDDGLAGDYGEAGDEMLHYPNGTLAVVRSPLGTPFGSGGVRLRVDGQHRITVLRTTRNGVLLRGLPPGNRWLEIEYGDQQAQLDVELLPGQVTTVSLGISRLAFLARLRARALADRIAVAEWFERFDDLSIEEIFLGGEEPGDLAPASSALDSLAPESPAPESPASGP